MNEQYQNQNNPLSKYDTLEFSRIQPGDCILQSYEAHLCMATCSHYSNSMLPFPSSPQSYSV